MPSQMSKLIPLLVHALVPDVSQGRVQTPGGCEKCQYRQEDWRDGGWCYMFREAPTPTCAQFRSAPARQDAAAEKGDHK